MNAISARLERVIREVGDPTTTAYRQHADHEVQRTGQFRVGPPKFVANHLSRRNPHSSFGWILAICLSVSGFAVAEDETSPGADTASIAVHSEERKMTTTSPPLAPARDATETLSACWH
jgi:hypothetical protein